MPKPISDQERAAILADIRAGEMSRNAIARKHGRSAGTITNIARETVGSTAFDRSATVNATRAKAVDMAAGRAALAERWLRKANEALDRSEALCLVYSFGGPHNEYAEHTLALPPAGEYRSFVTAAAVATDKLVALNKYDAGGDGVDQARSVIEDIMGALRGAD